ncbi:MAG: PstA family ABC transporter permease [Desulfobacterales bacterium]|nr:PstA family ABC transporter permease [Desulfobacterales bacterium]
MTTIAQKAPDVISDPGRMQAVRRSVAGRHRTERWFRRICFGITAFAVLLLVLFLAAILYNGIGTLSQHFLTAPPGPDPSQAGFYPAIWGTVWLLVLVAVFTLPLGIATAIFLEEFRPRRQLLRRALAFVQANITNLAGVPSVVYGIVGLTAFVSMFQLFGSPNSPAFEMGIQYYDQFYNQAGVVMLVPVNRPDAPYTDPEQGMTAMTPEGEGLKVHVIDADAPWPEDETLSARTLRENDMAGRIDRRQWYYFRIPFGRGVLAGALTLMLVILPIVIISAQESLRAVPDSLREAALGLGATRWQVVRRVTLPSALPGIMTGAILAISRAIGEAAPLLMIAGIVFISNPPGHLMDDFTAMPLQIFNWAQRPQASFHEIAASGIIVLLAVLLTFNAAAVLIRQKFQKPLS